MLGGQSQQTAILHRRFGLELLLSCVALEQFSNFDRVNISAVSAVDAGQFTSLDHTSDHVLWQAKLLCGLFDCQHDGFIHGHVQIQIIVIHRVISPLYLICIGFCSELC